MLTRSRVVQLLFMLFVLMLLFFWRTFDNIEQNPSVEQNSVNLSSCDYRDACEFITEQGTFFLSIKNLPIKAEEWIHFELLTPAENVQIKSAKIVGKSMFMGRIPVKFNKTSDALFSAKSLVGACTTPQMVWELQITTSIGAKDELLAFDFMVEK